MQKSKNENHSIKDTANIIKTSLIAFLLIIFINIYCALQLKFCVPKLPWQHKFHRAINSSSSASTSATKPWGRLYLEGLQGVQWRQGRNQEGKSSFHCLENPEIDAKWDFSISRVASEECEFLSLFPASRPQLSSQTPNSWKQSWLTISAAFTLAKAINSARCHLPFYSCADGTAGAGLAPCCQACGWGAKSRTKSEYKTEIMRWGTKMVPL